MSNITEQEKKFADEYVFLNFHAHGVSLHDAFRLMGALAVIYAEYDVSSNTADEFAKSLLSKQNIRQYVDSEIERFRSILSSEQRRNLWAYISKFTVGTPEQGACYGDMINH